MKCRTCGNEMEVRQTEAGKVIICRTCKVKRRLRKKEHEANAPQNYSNIPEEEARAKSERAVKYNYQQMLEAGEEERPQRKARKSAANQRRRKKKRTALKLLLILLLLFILTISGYFGYRYYRDHIAGAGQNSQAISRDQSDTPNSDSINVTTANFSIEYLKHELSIDQSGNPCLLFYYIYTNNRKDISSNALSDVTLTAAQSSGDCPGSTLAAPLEEVSNMAVDVEYNKSITVCQVFFLHDSSAVTISVSDLFDTNDIVLGQQTFQL